jgi:DNA-binding NarL/FixJ family response regulator
MRIILADHHAQPRWALRLLLEEQPDFDVTGEAVDGQSLLKLAAEQAVDLVLVDQELPGIEIEELILELHALKPRLVVIVLSSKSDNIAQLYQAGADAFVSKTDQPNRLLDQLFCFSDQIRQNEQRS